MLLYSLLPSAQIRTQAVRRVCLTEAAVPSGIVNLRTRRLVMADERNLSGKNVVLDRKSVG